MERQWLVEIQDQDPEVRRIAMRNLARSGDRRALEVLKWVHENDPDPALRDYAKRAAQYLWQQVKERKGTGQPSVPSRRHPPASSAAVEERDGGKQEIQEEPSRGSVPDKDKNEAHLKFERALSLHLSDKTENAINVFSKALDLNPDLCEEDQVAANLAVELTGLPAEEAVSVLLDEEQREGVLGLSHQEQEKTETKRAPVTLYLLIIAVLALIGLSYNFVRAGYLDRYRTWITLNLSNRYRHTSGGRKYYLIPPSGQKPPEGWPVVVGLHGYGGNGKNMLPIANTFTRRGIVYVAPTFGNYDPNPGAGPINPMVKILEDVNNQYPLHNRGVVLLGFSQGGTFAYRFSVYHPEWVAGVVTAGAPELDAIAPARQDLPYVFTWGSEDGLQDYVLPASVFPLMNGGYNVSYNVIQGAGHEITPYAIEQALQMVK